MVLLYQMVKDLKEIASIGIQSAIQFDQKNSFPYSYSLDRLTNRSLGKNFHNQVPSLR